MRHRRFIFCAVLFFEYGLIGLQAQDAIPATGGSVSVIGQGSVSYTVGQVLFTTNPGTTGSVTQGVQQPFEISILSGMQEAEDISLSFFVYPNPTSENLMLRTDDFKTSAFSFQLFDIYGKLLYSNMLSGNETRIDMRRLLPAIYFLKVFENNKELKSFEIIKKQ